MFKTFKITVFFIILTAFQAKSQNVFSTYRDIDTVHYESYRRQYMRDVDLDGDPDLLDQIKDGTMVVWYEHDANHNLFTRHTVSSLPDGETTSDFFPFDLDQDGDIDVMEMQIIGTTARFVWYENDGSGVFNEEHIVKTVANFETYSIMKLYDLDQDGDQDIVVAQVNGTNIYWFENKGDNLDFKWAVLIHTSNYYISNLTFVDMDHDGITDILYSSRDVSNGSTKAIQYTKRNAAGFYLETITLSESIRSDRFAVADLDTDGSIDVIVVDTLQNSSLVWFKNNGNGTFNTKIITIPDFTLTNFIPVNMDGDNDIDMLSLYNDNGNQEMAIYINDGTGIFTPGQTKNIGTISNIAGLFPIDWDNDQR